MNVLITSAGRRTSLLQAFKKATASRSGKLWASDIDGIAPTLYMADEAIRSPRVSDESYIEFLLALVEKNNIRLIVPTIDTELPKLSQNEKLFNDIGCILATSDFNLVDICQDKWKTVQVFSNMGIRVPESWLPEKYDNTPEILFVKPRNGSASVNTHKVTKNQLPNILQQVPDAIIQEYLPYDEITVDALMDFSGNLVHYVLRKRIRTIGGESIQGITISDELYRPFLINLFNQIGLLGGRGPLTVQLFLGKEGPILSEINPRFGGGFPLGLAAGGIYPEWLLQMIEGQTVSSRVGEYKTGIYMTRYYSEIITDHPLWDISS